MYYYCIIIIIIVVVVVVVLYDVDKYLTNSCRLIWFWQLPRESMKSWICESPADAHLHTERWIVLDGVIAVYTVDVKSRV